MKMKTARIPIMMGPEMVERIDDWAFKNRIRTRSEAMRRLISQRLEDDEIENKEADARA